MYSCRPLYGAPLAEPSLIENEEPLLRLIHLRHGVAIHGSTLQQVLRSPLEYTVRVRLRFRARARVRVRIRMRIRV